MPNGFFGQLVYQALNDGEKKTHLEVETVKSSNNASLLYWLRLEIGELFV